MKTITIALYSFNELTEETQRKAISLLSDLNTPHGWWNNTYEDAKRVNLKLTGFDFDRENYCNGDFITVAETTATLILKKHGQECDTFKTAKAFLNDYLPKKKKFEKENPGWYFTHEDEACQLEEDFLKAILKDYLRILKKECEFLESKEQIIETINANDYLFFEDGKLIPVKYYPEAKELDVTTRSTDED
jgi:hypothetical protein